jgi:uncharacterized protein (TIRG00374 family)
MPIVKRILYFFLRRWKLWLGLGVSAIFLYLALRGLKLDEAWRALTEAQYLWLIPGIAVFFVGVWVRTWRWHYLLRPLKKISTRKMFPIVNIGYMGNNIYPARAGEVLRAAVLKEREGVPISASLATVIIERIFDGVVMLGFVFLNLSELANLTADSGFIGSIQQVSIWGAVAFLGALLVFLLAAMFPRLTERVVNWLIDHLLPLRIREKVRGLALRFLTGLEALRSPYEALMIFLSTVIIWLLETGKYWFVMHAFNFEISFFALMLMNGIVNLATTLPSAPGYVGPFDASGIALLMAYNIPQATATAYTLVLHAALWFPITLVGAFYYLRQPLRWGANVQKLRAEEDNPSPGGVSASGELKEQAGTSAAKTGAVMKIAVVGAGFGGLSAAFDLVNAGHEVTIYEASPHTGGISAGFKEPGWKSSVEHFYHHIFQTDRDMLGLLGELGWKDRAYFQRPKTVVYHDGKFDVLDSPLSALTFPGFRFFDMVRFGFVTVYLRYIARWKPLEKVTADRWLRKAYGKKVYELLYEPLLQGKFGSHAQIVNMAWFWARVKARTTRLGTFHGGFQQLTDDLAAELVRRGVKLQLSTPVRQITPMEGGGLRVDSAAGSADFDRVLVTSSPAQMAEMAPSLPPDYLRSLLDLKSMGAVVVVFSLKHQLSEEGYYWFNLPKSAGYPFLALVEHTNFISAEEFGGEHIVYIGDYLDADHEHFRLSKEELVARFLPSLSRFNSKFQSDWVNKSWLFRTTYAQPIPPIHHSQHIPAIQTPIPGLYFASMSQVYPWDRGTNFAVQMGRQAAKLMLMP